MSYPETSGLAIQASAQYPYLPSVDAGVTQLHLQIYIYNIYIYYICILLYLYTFIYLQIYLHDGLQIQPKLQTLSLSMESYGVIHFASETKTRFFRQMSWRPQQHHGRCKIEEAQLNMTKRGCSFLIVFAN